MNFEIEGTLHKIYDVESKSASFQTREFVISTEGTYPQFVKFQSVQDRVGIIDGYAEGSKIKVSFDLRGREWQGKYFTNLNAWKIDKVSDAAAGGSMPDAPKKADNSFPPTGFEPFNAGEVGSSSVTQGDFDDLPF
jgi:single-strand DNA-binding protein